MRTTLPSYRPSATGQADVFACLGIGLRQWGQHVAGRVNLEQIWSSADGKAKRTIQRIDVLTPDLAVVRVTAEFENNHEFPAIDETFMLVKESGGWKIGVHQAMRP